MTALSRNFFSALILISIVNLHSSCLFSQGPNVPESSGFEPIDATDMVNLVTGDLTYVLPLLDVPSPEGGYPLTLAYHAGIAIDQEASWVGLGWNINPGAINRSVSGFPDDWKEGGISSIVYDHGGEISSHNFNVGVGWGDGKYSVGLYGSYVENKAFGGETTYRFGIDGISGSIGGRSYSESEGLNESGNAYVRSVTSNYSVGIGHSFSSGETSMSLSASRKVSSTDTNTGKSSSTSFNGSVGITSANYFGSSRANHNSGYSGASAGDSFNFNASIFLLRINYSFNKIRYWYFDKKTYSGVGSLYAENITDVRNGAIFEDEQGFDAYSSTYDQTQESSFDNNIVLPSYDFYSVSGQGLAGTISPKIFEYGTLTPKRSLVNHNGSLYSSNYYDKDVFSRKLDSGNISFYFDNTNTSYLDLDSAFWGSTPSSASSITSINSPPSSLTSSVIIDGVNYDNYNSILNRKKSAAFIETYTNEQIILNQTLVHNPNNFTRNSSSIPQDGIGAFKITSADGKTYHYSLPVYQKEKFSRASQYEEDIENEFYEEYQVEPYATHWLLTAITGSDYVDDGDGNISDNDLGYWVVFDYGKWSDGYTWRTPRGNDNKSTTTSKIYEWGVKEIYYLNTVKTRTHTALFVKSERQDGISIPKSMDREFLSTTLSIKKCRYDADTQAWYFNGLGFDSPSFDMSSANQSLTYHRVKMNFDRKTHNLLKLDKIILVKNEDIPSSFSFSNPAEAPATIKCDINIQERVDIYDRNNDVIWQNGFVTIHDSSWSGEFYENILDDNDINYNFPNIYDFSVKTIEMEQSYTLASNTPSVNNSTTGRLTLDKLRFRGKSGSLTLPPFGFEYENPSKDYNLEEVDDWGYTKNYTTSWNLNKITQPTGAKIAITYEEDDFYTEAASYETLFSDGLKFTFSNVNSKLRILAENVSNTNPNNVVFSDFFDSSSQTKIDMWACVDHEYLNFLSCENRRGRVDIPEVYVDVISVNSNSVLLETSLSYTSQENGGLGWLYSGSNGPSYWSYDMGRFQDLPRGVCPDQEGNCDNTRYNLKYKIYSNKNETNRNGGGLRVKKIAVNTGAENYETKYYYNQDGFDKNKDDSNYKSSGITSYAPSNYTKNIKYMAELPPPSVLYNTVTVETDLDINKYYFKTLSPEVDNGNEYFIDDILHIEKTQNEDNIPIDITAYNNSIYNVTSTLSKYKYEIKNNFSMLGRLLKKEKYNKSNQLLSRVETEYFESPDILQGLNKETFNSYGRVYYSPPNSSNLYENYHLTISSKTTYPSITKSVKTYSEGMNHSEDYIKFDFNTGQVLETISEDSKGNRLKTEIVPAYTIPDYNPSSGYGMGSKVDDITNKNMLTQQAISKSYIEVSGQWKETGVGITTWNNDWTYSDSGLGTTTPTADNEKIWRKHKSFAWDGDINPDGTLEDFNSTTDDDFNWALGANVSQTNDKWKNISTTTKYDYYSMPLEVKDINGNYATTKMVDNDSKVLFTTNSKYYESVYSGFEYGVEPQISYYPPLRTTQYAHTGEYSIKLTSGYYYATSINFKANEFTTGYYKLSVWVHKDNYQNIRFHYGTGSPPQEFNGEIVFAGDWVQMNHNAYMAYAGVNQNPFLASANGDVYIDDLRIHPVSSSMTSYVYNEWDELTDILGPNNLGTHFKYDDAGRLIETYQEVADTPSLVGGFKLASKSSINYKGTEYGNISTYSQVVSINCNTVFDVEVYSSLGTVQSWDIDFGDGSNQQGSGNPPATISHSYTSTGPKTITMSATNSDGLIVSFDTQIQVVPSYYFETVSNSGNIFSVTKTVTLYGEANQPIEYKANFGGQSSSGYNFSIKVGSNPTIYESGQSGSTDWLSGGNYPANGQVTCTITIEPLSGSQSDPASLTLNVKKPGNCGQISTTVSYPN